MPKFALILGFPLVALQYVLVGIMVFTNTTTTTTTSRNAGITMMISNRAKNQQSIGRGSRHGKSGAIGRGRPQTVGSMEHFMVSAVLMIGIWLVISAGAFEAAAAGQTSSISSAFQPKCCFQNNNKLDRHHCRRTPEVRTLSLQPSSSTLIRMSSTISRDSPIQQQQQQQQQSVPVMAGQTALGAVEVLGGRILNTQNYVASEKFFAEFKTDPLMSNEQQQQQTEDSKKNADMDTKPLSPTRNVFGGKNMFFGVENANYTEVSTQKSQVWEALSALEADSYVQYSLLLLLLLTSLLSASYLNGVPFL